jgi:hypothetical protein
MGIEPGDLLILYIPRRYISNSVINIGQKLDRNFFSV